jgi:3-hydroxyacyl-CoA dehydrogenase/enoyl-CoA hydratase/3-hydroxybutyryl-CoA epimerase
MNGIPAPAVRYERDDDGVVTLTLDDPMSSVNTMNDRYVEAMALALDRLEAERDDIAGVVVASAKRSFFAGADLVAVQGARPEDAAALFEQVEAVKGQLRRLERLGRPVVAALGGSALGGGLEIALACHHRIAVDDPGVELGLPEVTLGLLPGGGGTTRMVRMFGLQVALTQWLLQGQRRRPDEAHTAGLVDELVATADALLPAAHAWVLAHRDNAEAASQPWDRPGYRMPGGTPATPALAAALPAFPATLRAQLKGAPYPAPRAILSAAVEGAQVDVDTALRIESRYFVELATGPVSTNMIQVFFVDLPSLTAPRPAEAARHRASSVAVLGAGMMGSGIAYECARRGLEVVLRDVTDEAAAKGKQYAEKLLDAQVSRGRLSADRRGAVLDRIRPSTDLGDLARCDVVVEAVFEDSGLKSRVLAQAEAAVRPDALLASNTSTLPISGLAAALRRPEAFVGLHFFSPVDKMRLVEVIRGGATSEETLTRAVDFVHQIHKVPIVVRDGRGFYTTRVFATLLSEAVALLGEGVEPTTVERAATMAGFPSPPLAMLDEVSLTLTQHIRAQADAAAAAAGLPRRVDVGASIIDRMVDELGRPGRAAGAGFYDYPEGATKRLWPGLRDALATSRPSTPVPLRDIEDRYLFTMALETARCVEDGVLDSAAAANVGSILGIGYPAWTGGTVQFMTAYAGGLLGFVARAKELAAAYGTRFEPSPWLVETATTRRKVV